MIELDMIWRPETQQALYRRLLRAMSYPGRTVDVNGQIGRASVHLAVLATLLDSHVTFCDFDQLLSDDEIHMLQCRPDSFSDAAFVLARGAQCPKAKLQPNLGTVYRPHTSATLVLSVAAIGEGGPVYRLRGPGVAGETELRLDGCSPEWMRRRADWVAAYPMGVDMLVCDAHSVVALPRTTRLRVG
jgi:alpha-D-ribose 1-methylphosphonate 5-triphosphate synthase subunit PhnH